MKQEIPRLLYRGDADCKNIRDLKVTLHFGQLQTNLLKGGQGHAVFTTPIIDLVARHVDPGWALTHFLSFSEDKVTALRFGMDCEYEEVERCLENYRDHDDAGNDWKFAVIVIDTTTISWQQTGIGIYHGTYTPSLTKFAIFPGQSNVILIDVRKAIHAFPNHPNYEQVLANAVRDLEWLLLPATPTILNGGVIEYSSIMDGKCIVDIERYIYLGA